MTDRSRGLEGRYYTDPNIFDRELDVIFARTWIMVGHSTQVANHGDIITAQVGDENVFVANDRGTVRAFYNVCQHRGHELISTDATNTPVIPCPYHAWTYDLSGTLAHARGEEVGKICIPRIRLETMAGYLFVNLDDSALPLAETVPGVEAELHAVAPDADQRLLTSRRTHLINANWKIAVENYNECYHCPNVHKTFTSGVVDPNSYRINPRGFTIHHTAEGPPEGQSGYARHAEGNDYGSFFTWPTSSIQCYPGQVLNTFRWVPLTVDQTLLIREWWFDTTEPTEAQQEIINLDWDTTVSEDFDIMESVQRGMSSRGYTPGPLITRPDGIATTMSEDTVPHIHSLVRAALGDG